VGDGRVEVREELEELEELEEGGRLALFAPTSVGALPLGADYLRTRG